MSKANTESTPHPVRINRRKALVSGGAALSVGAAASGPAVVAEAALLGEPDQALIDLWARCQQAWEVWDEANTEFSEFEFDKTEKNAPVRRTLEQRKDALFDKAIALEHRIVDSPAAGFAGIAIKLGLFINAGDLLAPDGLIHDDCYMSDQALVKVWLDAKRLAGGVS